METFYLLVIAFLLCLAIFDMFVGVSNDAVNFLSSAVGSKAARFKTVLIIAAVGILVGTATSSGMMDIARHGILQPQNFTYAEVMCVFLAVVCTDVMILDIFNSLGLPTSTTVSMVFELFGGATAMAVIKMMNDGGMYSYADYINTEKVLSVIMAIFVSVAIAFVVGLVVMWLSRIVFTFHYERHKKWTIGIFGGISITSISYFLITKGFGQASFMTPDVKAWISLHSGHILISFLVFFTILTQILSWLKVNIFKIVVLFGTFSLAMAFAGNDLVNFIGVPLAGFDSYTMVLESGNESMLMGDLTNSTPATIWLLLIAGLIMAVTLFFSRDAMKVSATELKLSSQNAEDERFGSSPISRSLVRFAINANRNLRNSLPASVIDAVNRRFIPTDESELNGANYDKIRAVVNLTAAAILICLGTSLKLPLSTTYVVFMVAMGSSLADRAWGRDSAVYRISGVLIVISGWFLTAIIGFTLSLLIGLFIAVGEGFALIALVIVCGYLLCRRFIATPSKNDEDVLPVITNDETDKQVLYTYTDAICRTMNDISGIYNRMLVALYTENRNALKEEVQHSQALYRKATEAKYGIVPTLTRLEQLNISTAHFYVQVVDYICEVTKALMHCTRPAYDHLNNNHRGFTGEQIKDLKQINDQVNHIFSVINEMLSRRDFSQLDSIMDMRDALFDTIAACIKSQIKRLKEADSSTRAGALYFNLLNETKTMVLQARNVIKAQAYFLNEIKVTNKDTESIEK